MQVEPFTRRENGSENATFCKATDDDSTGNFTVRAALTVNLGEKELHLQKPITTCHCPLFYFPLSKWSSLDTQ